MTIDDFSWDAFKKTGAIEAYLLHKEVEKQREISLWRALKQEESSQDAQIIRNQTVC